MGTVAEGPCQLRALDGDTTHRCLFSALAKRSNNARPLTPSKTVSTQTRLLLVSVPCLTVYCHESPGLVA